MAGGGGGREIIGEITGGKRPTGPFFFWCMVMTVGILFLVFGTGNSYIMVAGVLLSLPGAVFTAGTFWVCLTGKKTYGNVDDLV